MRNRQWMPAILTAALALPLVAACSSEPKPDKPLNSFVAAWQSGKLGGLNLVDASGATLTGDAAQTQLTALEGDLAKSRPKLTVAGKAKVRKNDATAPVTVAWPVSSGVTWSYQTTVKLVKRKDRWLAVFSPQTVHPDLPSGTGKLTVKASSAERGGILDGAGQPIVTNRPVVIVGVEPQRVTDQTVLIGFLKSIFREAGADVDLTTLPDRLKNAKPDAFVEIVTLRKDVYDRVRTDLRNLTSIVTRDSTASLAPTREFGRALLGQTSDVTKEILDKNPGKYKVGDKVGVTGLQQRYDERLRGTAGVSVSFGDKKLFEQAATVGNPVRTTLDVKTQTSADKALAGEARRSALVAIRISTGQVVAVANGPGGGQLNLAFTAAVPPGSTFKTVSALGLLDAGKITADTPQDCPKNVTVDGFTFKNSGDEAFGAVPFKTDFAHSCNNAFVKLAPQLGDDGLANAAKTLGIGVEWDLGIEAFSGKASQGGGASERAAAAIGQGTTLVSPVAIAGAAAAVARGQWKQPVLLLDPAPTKVAADGPALKPTSAEQLRLMMREVVLTGTAKSLKGLAGAPLFGKTGTAEFDTADPKKTHSWFMGWKGDIAFAAFVENGGASTDSAVPIAGKFLLDLGV